MRSLHPFSAIVLASSCVILAVGWARADDRADSNARIKALQQQRLQAAVAARDDLFRQLHADDLLIEVTTCGFTGQLLEAHKLVFHARLDLCDAKADRIKAIDQTIKEFQPTLAIFERHFQNSIVGSTAPYRLAQALLLEMQIAQEKAKQEAGGP
jgi:hypothetical protein